VGGGGGLPICRAKKSERESKPGRSQKEANLSLYRGRSGPTSGGGQMLRKPNYLPRSSRGEEGRDCIRKG